MSSANPTASISEFNLIARIRARAGARGDVLLGIGDDAALLQTRPGQQLVAAVDTLNAGVHFPLDTAPADIGWKALAVNLSDLAAMGAEPAWALLSLSLPESDPAWLDAFIDGFVELAAQHDVGLVGGDTTRGPRSVSVTLLGFVPNGAALRRDAALEGDEVWVTGTLGDAAAALAGLMAHRGGVAESGSRSDIALSGTSPDGAKASARLSARAPARAGARVGLRGDPANPAAPSAPARAEPGRQDAFAQARLRLDRPTPRVAAGLALRGLAHACIDLSDGLAADLGHVLAASGVGAEIALEALPCSPALGALAEGEARWRLQVSGGDDYELCFTAPPSQHAAVRTALAQAGVEASCIGRIVAGDGLLLRRPDGGEWRPPRPGYRHFDPASP
jgi:thiamine-monophosphate kinase